MPLSAKWTRLSPLTSLHRSSLALAVVGNKAYVFGGELVPRVPLNANVEIVDLQSTSLPVATLERGFVDRADLPAIVALQLARSTPSALSPTRQTRLGPQPVWEQQ